MLITGLISVIASKFKFNCFQRTIRIVCPGFQETLKKNLTQNARFEQRQRQWKIQVERA
jgi:hypothetical protein